MQFLNTTDIATLHTELQRSVYSGLNDTQRLAYLTTPEQVANPISTAPQIPKPFSRADILGCLSSSSLANIRVIPNQTDLFTQIDNNNRAAIEMWAIGLNAGTPLITSGEVSAISAILAATHSDPSWTATVTGPTPLFRLFAGKGWSGTADDGSNVFTYTPSIDDVAAAR